MPLEGTDVHRDGVLDELFRLEVFENAADLGITLLHGHDLLNVFDIAREQINFA